VRLAESALAFGRDRNASCSRLRTLIYYLSTTSVVEGGFKPKFTKRYANLTEVALQGISKYIAEVRSGTFPDDDQQLRR
jgi:hypothetical protein